MNRDNIENDLRQQAECFTPQQDVDLRSIDWSVVTMKTQQGKPQWQKIVAMAAVLTLALGLGILVSGKAESQLENSPTEIVDYEFNNQEPSEEDSWFVALKTFNHPMQNEAQNLELDIMNGVESILALVH